MKTLKLSIIIPTANYSERERQIHRIIAALQSQTSESILFEIIITRNCLKKTRLTKLIPLTLILYAICKASGTLHFQPL